MVTHPNVHGSSKFSFVVHEHAVSSFHNGVFLQSLKHNELLCTISIGIVDGIDAYHYNHVAVFDASDLSIGRHHPTTIRSLR